MGRSLWSVIALSAVAARWCRPPPSQRPGTPRATSCRPATSAGCRSRTNSTRPASALRRAHAPARKRHRGRHQPALPARELQARSGKTTTIDTGRPGLRLVYDDYGVPHVYGKTRADVAFGAGWTTARDRRLLILLGRGPARVAVADVPGIDAFGLVTSAQTFVPSPQAEALVTKQRKLIVKSFGAKGRQIIARRPGLRRRHQRLREGHRRHAAAGHRQRRDRGHRLHRLDLRRRRRRRGEQLASCSPSSSRGSARSAATRPGTT